jgi:exonuclease SbcC
MQDLTERRLAGIAAELAGRLEEGQPCQVCGSTEHPQPARPAADAVTEAEQAEAAAAYEACSAEHTAAGGKVLQAEERLEAFLAAASRMTPAEAERTVVEATTRLREAQQAEVELAAAEQQVAALTAEQEDLTAAVNGLATRVATLTQSVTTHQEKITSLDAELAAALGGPVGEAATSLSAQVAHLDDLAVSLAKAHQTLAEHESALARVEELTAHVGDAALEHGFTDVPELRAALLPSAERSRLEGLLETRRERESHAQAVLHDDEVRAVEETTPPDLAALAEQLATAEEQEAAASRSLLQREDVSVALRRHRARLEEALASWGPLREEYHRADSMARLVRGMGTDNQLQMRLSAYVLATRLDQVVAAANERLAHMRDQRYLLQRTGRAARKGSQAGLGLEIVDQWTGDVRDPATLSGGETFVVSLALALGLADVVTQEAGGTEIETLFVDEGFGTLDADTLDDVMDRLDDLRAGGRAVGVVSHVSELRNRIPTQLHVEKRRNGSSVAVRTAAG